MRYKPQPRRIRHITNKLRVLRADRRWTQDDVAMRLGLGSRFRYWQIENQEVEPTAKERAKLAKMFGVSEATIWPTPLVGVAV